MSKLSTTFANIVQARSGGAVERCHGIRHNGSYSNAAHSWGVAMLLYYLWPQDFPRLAIHCLAHDIPEAWTGDRPAPMNRYFPNAEEKNLETVLLLEYGLPDIHALPTEDRAKLKACDSLELYIWTREQICQGNMFPSIFLDMLDQFYKESPLPPEAAELYELMRRKTDGCFLPQQGGVVHSMAQRMGVLAAKK